MEVLDVYVNALEAAWSHEWESLQSTLRNLDEEEAAWVAPGYDDTATEEGWPREGSVLWLIAHVAHCKRYYAQMLRAHREPSPPEVRPREPLAGLREELGALESAHQAQMEALRAVDPSDWERPTCGKMALGPFLAMTIRHDAWHGGQIAVLRRLYRSTLGHPTKS